jgi:predicted Zn-dependent protease
MISREPTIERLATARQLLLEPFGLDETHLARALAEIRSHQVDDADLYVQYTRAEGWSLEEGIVKTGSFSIDQGVGVRAVSGAASAKRSSFAVTLVNGDLRASLKLDMHHADSEPTSKPGTAVGCPT